MRIRDVEFFRELVERSPYEISGTLSRGRDDSEWHIENASVGSLTSSRSHSGEVTFHTHPKGAMCEEVPSLEDVMNFLNGSSRSHVIFYRDGAMVMKRLKARNLFKSTKILAERFGRAECLSDIQTLSRSLGISVIFKSWKSLNG